MEDRNVAKDTHVKNAISYEGKKAAIGRARYYTRNSFYEIEKKIYEEKRILEGFDEQIEELKTLGR